MRSLKVFAFLIPLACLLGCTLPPVSATQTGATPSLTGNWQIQSGAALTSPPAAPYFVGALQGADSALAGTFSTAQSGSLSPVVEGYSGTYNASTASMVLTSTLPLPANQIAATLAVPADPTSLSTGTLVFQCGVCGVVTSSPVVAAEIAPLNNTYTGVLSGTLASASQSATPVSGTASLTLTQSTTPNSSGQFPLTGTLTITALSGSGTAPFEGPGSTAFTGTISGVGFTLNYCSEAVIGPCIALTGHTNPTATQITVSNYTYSDAGADGTSATLTGTLTLQ